MSEESRKCALRRVVVTGIGAVSPFGEGVETLWENLCAGRSGIKRITRFDTTGYDTTIAGEVRDFDPERWLDKKEARKADRFVQFAVAADAAASATRAVMVRCNDQVPHGTFVAVLDEAKAQGAAQIAVMGR